MARLPLRTLTAEAIDGGLADDGHRFHTSSAAVAEAADPQAVKSELEAQFARARAAGIDVTHMGTVCLVWTVF